MDRQRLIKKLDAMRCDTNPISSLVGSTRPSNTLDDVLVFLSKCFFLLGFDHVFLLVFSCRWTTIAFFFWCVTEFYANAGHGCMGGTGKKKEFQTSLTAFKGRDSLGFPCDLHMVDTLGVFHPPSFLSGFGLSASCAFQGDISGLSSAAAGSAY
jgi:hypothetical protein